MASWLGAWAFLGALFHGGLSARVEAEGEMSGQLIGDAIPSSPFFTTPRMPRCKEEKVVVKSGQTAFYYNRWPKRKLLSMFSGPGNRCKKSVQVSCDSENFRAEISCPNSGDAIPAASDDSPDSLCSLQCQPSAYESDSFTFEGVSSIDFPETTRMEPLSCASSAYGSTTADTPPHATVSTSSPSNLPSAEEMGIVAGFARTLQSLRPPTSSSDAPDPDCAIYMRPRSAVGTLLEYAKESNRASDGFDSDKQALTMLWALYLANYPVLVRVHPIIKLARDIQKVESFESMELEELTRAINEGTVSGNRWIKGLAHYYRGVLLKQQRQEKAEAKNKHAVVFTCSFGGGHKSAADAAMSYLAKVDFSSKVIDTTYDPGFDTIGNKIGGVWFNDFIIKRQHYSVHNFLDKGKKAGLGGYCYPPECDLPRFRSFREAVLDEKPDLLVTVYHMELMGILRVAKELGNLPLLHLATDMDIKMREVFPAPVIYTRIEAGIPFNVKKSYTTIAPLERKQTFLSGYPVREAFLNAPTLQADLDALHLEAKAKLVPEGTTVLLVMSGGGGQDLPWPYKLARKGIGERLHIIVVAGANVALATNLRAKMPGNVTFSLPSGERTVWQGEDKSVTLEVAKDPTNTNAKKLYYVYAERLAYLMDASDVILTKPGGGSTAEVAYRGLPAIFDTTFEIFHWEQFTVDVFVETNRGIAFKTRDAFRDALRAASRLNRSTVLAQDKRGRIIDPAIEVSKAAVRLLTKTVCQGCGLLAPMEKQTKSSKALAEELDDDDAGSVGEEEEEQKEEEEEMLEGGGEGGTQVADLDKKDLLRPETEDDTRSVGEELPETSEGGDDDEMGTQSGSDDDTESVGESEVDESDATEPLAKEEEEEGDDTIPVVDDKPDVSEAKLAGDEESKKTET